MVKITRHSTNLEIGRQIFFGTLALQTLLESANLFYHRDVPEIKERVLSSIDLTPEQTNYFNNVVERVDKAVKIVSFLRRKFGFEFGNQTKDQKGLLSLISDDLGSSYIKIKQNRMSFGLFPSKWLKENSHSGGFVKGNDQDDLDLSLDEIKSLINKGDLNSFTALSYVVSPKKHFENIVEDRKSDYVKFLDRVFPNTQSDYVDLYAQSIERHELRHLFDKVIGNKFANLFGESSAHLYESVFSEFVVKNGMRRDFPKLESELKRWENRFKRLKDLDAPETILIREKKYIELYGNLKKDFNEFQPIYVDSIRKILRAKKNSVLPTLSFIFSATRANNEKQYFDKVTKNFQLATKYVLKESNSQLTDSMNVYYGSWY